MRRDFLVAAGARLFAVMASFASGIISLKLYGHFFTPDAYGVIIVALQLIGYLPALDGGFRTAANRRLLAAPSPPRSLLVFSQTIYAWLLVFGFALAAVVMLIYDLLAEHRSSSEWGWPFFLSLAGSGAISMFASAQAGLLLGLGAQARMSVITGVGAVTSVTALGIALHSGWEKWAFPLSMLASATVIYALALVGLKRLVPNLPRLPFATGRKFRAIFREIRGDAWRVFRSQISILLLFSADLILVSFFCPPAQVAVYGVLSRIFGIARGFLQTLGETAWPLVARRTSGYETFQDWLLRANGWIYGAAGGVIIVVTPAFVGWYMGPEWRPSETLCWLFILRFLVMGASSPASYFLLGAGDFRSIARCCEREVLVALVLGGILGHFHGANGVALGFLLATNAGTFLPLLAIYARSRGERLAALLGRTWLRVAAAFAVTFTLGELIARAFPPG